MTTKTLPSAFLRAKVLQLVEAEDSGGVRLFAHVQRIVALESEVITNLPNYPAALLFNSGGQISGVNNEIWSRGLSVTVVIRDSGDHFTDDAADKLDLLVEGLVDELQGSRNDNAIIAAWESEDQGIFSEDGIPFVMKTVVFGYDIDRTL